jgi:hypothetical protein
VAVWSDVDAEQIDGNDREGPERDDARMSLSRYYARAGGDPVLIALVARDLAARWDPQREFESPSGESDPDAHAKAILAILATGADFAAVAGYLRRAEETALGTARSDGHLRHDLAHTIWRAMVDAAVEAARHAPDADPPADDRS